MGRGVMVVGGYGVSCVRGRWEKEKGEETKKMKSEGERKGKKLGNCKQREQ